MNPREFDEQLNNRQAKPPWWRFGQLRVRLRFAGMEVRDHPRIPPELIGTVIPWGAAQYGLFAAYTSIFGEDGEPIRSKGRRWFARVSDTREIRAARRLYIRWVRRQVASGRTVEARYAAERGVRWILWPLGAAAFILSTWMALSTFGNLGWLRGQSITIMLLTVLTLVGYWSIHGLMIVWAFWMAWKLGQPVAEKVRINAIGFTATMTDGTQHSVNWNQVRSVSEQMLFRRVLTYDGFSINMGKGCRAWHAVWPQYVAADGSQRESRMQNDRPRDRLDARTYRRILRWLCGGMLFSFGIGAWAGATGLLPHPWWLSGLIAAGQLGSVLAMVMIMQHWPYAWFRRQMKRLKRRRRDQYAAS